MSHGHPADSAAEAHARSRGGREGRPDGAARARSAFATCNAAFKKVLSDLPQQAPTTAPAAALDTSGCSVRLAPERITLASHMQPYDSLWLITSLTAFLANQLRAAAAEDERA